MFDSVTTIGLLLTLVMIFSFQGNTILEKPLHIVLIAVPLILQTFLIFAIAYIACRVLKLPYKIAAPAGMICASNFFELAVAVAIALFGTTSPAALATTVGVLTEVPVMLFLVKNANKTKDWGVVPFSWTVIRGGDGHGEVHEGTAATRGRVVCEIRGLRGGCDPRAGVSQPGGVAHVAPGLARRTGDGRVLAAW